MTRPEVRPGMPGLVCRIVVIAGAVFALHVAGRGRLAAPDIRRPAALASWITRTPLVDVVMVVLRVAAVVAGAYLLLVVALALLGCVIDHRPTVDVARRLLPSSFHRLLALSTGAAMLGASMILARPAGAQPPANHRRPAVSLARAGRPPNGSPSSTHPAPPTMRRLAVPPRRDPTAGPSVTDGPATAQGPPVLRRVRPPTKTAPPATTAPPVPTTPPAPTTPSAPTTPPSPTTPPIPTTPGLTSPSAPAPPAAKPSEPHAPRDGSTHPPAGPRRAGSPGKPRTTPARSSAPAGSSPTKQPGASMRGGAHRSGALRPEQRPSGAGERATSGAREPFGVWVVAPGDSFWSIATERVAEQLGRRPGCREVAPYWSRLIRDNLDRLPVPGDPDLLFPGDRLRLPPLGHSSTGP